MKQNATVTHAILWAAAVLSAAILHAPLFLTLVLLPMLAACSLVVAGRRRCEPARPTE